MRLAYSYIRFSSPEQKKGDSKRRQWEATELFCKQNDLILEKSRQFYDEGKYVPEDHRAFEVADDVTGQGRKELFHAPKELS
jgi:hypothetical protein